MQDTGESVPTTGRPKNPGRAGGLIESHFSVGSQIPEIHFSLSDVAEPSNENALAKWAYSNGVSKPLSEFKKRLSIRIVHSGCGGLLSWYHNELVSIIGPLNVLDLVVKCWNEQFVFSLVNFYILQRVLSIITFSRLVIKSLSPNQNSMPSWRRQNFDILSFWTLDLEFRVFRVSTV